MSEDEIYYYQWGFFLIWTLLLIWLSRSQIEKANGINNKTILISTAALFVGALVARLLFDYGYHAPTLRREEVVSSILYPMTLFGDLETYSGLTQFTYAAVLHAYHSLFGFDLYDARLVGNFISVASTVLAFWGAKRMFGLGLALFFGVLLTMSLTGFGYVSQSTEISWALSALGFCFFIYSFKRTAVWWQIWSGISLAFSCLTYPSFMIAFFCVILAIVIVEKRKAFALLKSNLWVFASCSLGLLITAVLHKSLYEDTALFKGGGQWTNGLEQYGANLLVLIRDVFVKFDSYNSPHMKPAFIEIYLLAPFVFGAWIARKSNDNFMRICVWTTGLIFFATATASVYPGMRRGITLLFFFYFVVAYGINKVVAKGSYKAFVFKAILFLTAVFQIASLYEGYRHVYITEKYMGNYAIEGADFKNLAEKNFVAFAKNPISDLDQMYLDGYASSSDAYNKTSIRGKYKIVPDLNAILEIETQGKPIVLFYPTNLNWYWSPIMQELSGCTRRFENIPSIPTWGQPYEIWQIKNPKTCVKST